jgi:cysteine desulfurase
MVRNGRVDKTLPNTLSVSFPGINAYDLIALVNETVCFSAGAACHSGGPVASETLRAMAIPSDVALGTVRISTGRLLQKPDIERALQFISRALDSLLAAK